MFGNFFGGGAKNDTPANNGDTSKQPNNQQTPANPNGAAADKVVNPLDQYAEMFDPEKTKAAPNIQDLTSKLFNMSDEVMDQELANANLLVISQDQLTAMKESGMNDAAIAAQLQIMNNSMKQVLKMSAKTSAGAVTHGLNNSANYVNSQVSSTLAKHNAAEAVRGLGGAIDHPAMAIIREPLINALATQYPNVSQSELKAHAETMFNNMMTGMGYEKKAAPKIDPEDFGRDFSGWVTPSKSSVN